jgi:nucleotide-binding universal stress UspA family protein
VAAIRYRARDELQAQVRRIQGVAVRSVLRDEGPVHDGVLATAGAVGADLIVIGTHGRTGLRHALLGCVAERIVRLSPIPVLTVRRPA